MGATYISMSAANYIAHTIAAIAAGAVVGAVGAAAFMNKGPRVDDIVRVNEFKKAAISNVK